MTDITTAAVSGGVLAGGCPEIAAAFDAYQGQVEQSATHSLSPKLEALGGLAIALAIPNQQMAAARMVQCRSVATAAEISEAEQ